MELFFWLSLFYATAYSAPFPSMVFPTDEGPTASLTCEDKFVHLLKPASFLSAKLPNRISLPLTDTDTRASFNLALSTWEKNVDVARLKRVLHRIEADPHSADDFAAELKNARKFSSILRSHYLLLGKNHKAPKEFDQFTKDLGKLNDAIANRAGKKELRALADETERSLRDTPGAIAKKGFTPAPLSSLRARLDWIRDSISDITGDELPTPNRFHEARKAARELLGYYQGREAMQPSPENQAAYQFLFQVNEDMGKIHDEFLTQVSHGDFDYKNQKFFLNPVLREKLVKLEAALVAD